MPITRADEPKVIGVPDTVIAGLPGVKIVPSFPNSILSDCDSPASDSSGCWIWNL